MLSEEEICRPPRGGRGLKYPGGMDGYHRGGGRPPRGGRGLKLDNTSTLADMVKSPPSRGAWIEMGR